MRKLVDGIHRFQSGVFGGQKDLFARLSKGQEPDALFLTCSDSRISPTLITQTVLGDLFILRNAGNIVPPYGSIHGGEAATIEYAIEALAVKDIIICGHTHCGAMNAVLDPTGLEGLPAMKAWLTYAEATRRVMKTHYKNLREEDMLEACIEENVLVQIENLRTHPISLGGDDARRIAAPCLGLRDREWQRDGLRRQHRPVPPVAGAGHGVAERADRLKAIRQI